MAYTHVNFLFNLEEIEAMEGAYKSFVAHWGLAPRTLSVDYPCPVMGVVLTQFLGCDVMEAQEQSSYAGRRVTASDGMRHTVQLIHESTGWGLYSLSTKISEAWPTPCPHTWTHYVGLTQSFEYCSTCDVKRGTSS